MSTEFWAIVGVGVALLGIVLPTMIGLFAILRGDIVDLRWEVAALRDWISLLEQRVASLEGRFEEMRRWSEQLIGALVNRPAA